MSSLYTLQSSNIRKTWALVGVFLVVVMGLGYFFSVVYHSPQILYVAVIFSVLMNVASYWYSDKVVLAISGAREIKDGEIPLLQHVVENLAITAGLPTPRIYLMSDLALNAFATGRDKKHAAVAVTSGLLSVMNKTELEGVIAHELSHIGNRDILISTMIVVLVGFVTLLSDFFLRMSLWGGGARERDEGGQARMIVVVLGVALAILSPIIATLIQLAISRKREFLADASGALLTRYPEGLASALQKISLHDRKMAHANNATAHLFIANPFGAGAGKGLAKLFMTHPPLEERIKILRGL